MKRSACFNYFLALVICLTPMVCPAQTTNDCDQLRRSIQELEQIDISGMSPTLQKLYKESILKLYMRFSECLQVEIGVVSKMQKAVVKTEAAGEVESKLRSLIREQSDNDSKIKIMRIALNLPNNAPTSAPDSAAAVMPLERSSEGIEPRSGNRADSRMPIITPSTASISSITSETAPASGVPTLNPTAPATPATQVIPNCAEGAAYDSAPGILKDLANGLAADVISQNNPDIAAQAGPQMVLYTVFDAASPKSSELVQGLEAYHYLGETARTDKQLGASGNSDGAVSSIEKPGFAQLLGFAIEHGGITKQNDGTNLTLSTSLYSLYTLGNKDTATNYARAGILNRVALAATFAVDNQDNDLANVRRNNLSEWSAKIRLFGDRSTRSPGFQKVFNEKVKPLIRERLRTLGRSIDELATKNAKYGDLEDAALDTLPDEVRARMACPDYTAATPQQKQMIISGVILGRLRTAVYNPVSTRSFDLGASEIARIEGEFLPNLKKALDNLVLADKILADAVAELQKGPLATFAYTNHRIPDGSDYSDAKFLFEQEKGFMGPLKLVGNLGLSIYNRPNPTLNQQRLRDISAALSFEGSKASPFTEAGNQSRITFAFVGRYQRLFENRQLATRTPDIGTLQFVTEIPFIKGMSLPLSITYANATEEERKQGFRFNFGMHLDTDKLFDLLRAKQ